MEAMQGKRFMTESKHGQSVKNSKCCMQRHEYCSTGTIRSIFGNSQSNDKNCRDAEISKY